MSSTEFTDEYKESLKKSVFVDNLEEFFTPPPIITTTRPKRNHKRKSTPDSDSDYDVPNYKDPSSDEDFSPSAKKSKYSKAGPKSRTRNSFNSSPMKNYSPVKTSCGSFYNQ